MYIVVECSSSCVEQAWHDSVHCNHTNGRRSVSSCQQPLTWKGEVSPCGLVGDPVVHDGQMFLEGLAQGPVGLGHELLLTLGAGD